jgi:hypothetical protein
MPVVAILSALSQEWSTPLLSAWRKGLGETGYVEGRNVVIELCFANGQYERLPALAGEFVKRPAGHRRDGPTGGSGRKDCYHEHSDCLSAADMPLGTGGTPDDTSADRSKQEK